MRLIFYILLVLFIPIRCQAQITLTAATNNPVPGDTCYSYMPLLSQPDPGSSGPNVIWDFSQLLLTDKKQFIYDSPVNFGCMPTYAANNIGAGGMSMCWYHEMSNDSFTISGYYQSMNTTSYTNNEVWVKYPMSYNSTVYTDSFRTTTSGPSFSNSTRAFQMIEADAYGTLILPDSTYNNVLRVKRTIASRSTSSGFNQPSIITESVYEIYEWYKLDVHRFLLRLRKNISTTDINNIEELLNTVEIYPNPASSILNISNSNTRNSIEKITVSDITGRILLQNRATGNSIHTVDVSQLPTGIYVVKIDTPNGAVLKKFTVQ